MPQSVCIDCRILFEHSYRFKQMCKKAETLLRQVPLTGEWPDEMVKPRLPPNFLSAPIVKVQKVDVPILLSDAEDNVEIQTVPVIKTYAPQKLSNVSIKRTNNILNGKSTHISLEPKIAMITANMPRKILNANPAKSPEPPIPKRARKEPVEQEHEDATTIFLNKVENDEELSIDDLHRLIEANTVEDVTHKITEKASPRPKLLNKSSIRILNKEADKVIEPQFSKPEVKRDKDGNVAIVTEMIDPTEFNIEVKNIKDAKPVETNVFPCPHCERSFPLRQLRDIHIVNHTRERSSPCPHCNKSFFSKYDLQKHLITHSGDKPFKCTVCAKAFTRATLLHRHEKIHTDIPKFICLYCEKPFISHEEMDKHAERHNKNRPFKCSICNKSFAFKQGLERHFVVHSNDQPFPCHYCDQSFPTSSKLARHLTAHAGRRPYPCKFCPKSFLLSHHLTRHLRSHKMSACSYACSNCKQEFNAREDLIRHSAEHTKITLICTLCREELSGADKVDEHIEAHVASDSFACAFCDMMFMSAESLQTHTNNDHAEDMQAYVEDDKKQQKNKEQKGSNKGAAGNKSQEKRKSSLKTDPLKLQKQPKTAAEKNADEQEEDELFQSIKEFLLTDNADIKTEEAAAQQEIILEDAEFIDEYSNKKDEKVLKVVEKVAEKVVEVSSPPAAKRGRNANKIAETTENAKKVIKKETVSPVTRGKTAAAAAAAAAAATAAKVSPKKLKKSPVNKKEETKDKDNVANKSKEKIETVLKSLPKYVSVRRYTPYKAKETANNEKKESPTKDIKPLAEAKKEGTASTSTLAENDTKKKRQKLSTECDNKETVAVKNESPTVSKVSPEQKQEDDMKSDEKVLNVKKIAISKLDAATMAKQGRLRIKDGKIVLTRSIVTEQEK